MRVVVAPDKFAGTLTASEAAEAMASGWRRGNPAAVLDVSPMSDGGPGFVGVLQAALGGDLVDIDVSGPSGERVVAQLLVHDQEGRRTVYVESAQACGIARVSPSSATAWESTTTGVGELLAAALESNPARVVVGVGGSASTDGGRGAVEAFSAAAAGGWPDTCELLVATDVTSPLLGPSGSAAAFAPQKGADQDTVLALNQRLEAWAALTRGPASAAGSGAGGGLGYGLLLLGGRVVPGVRTVLQAVRLRERIEAADLVITGEGRLDRSSLVGKVPAGVAALARDAARPCVVLAGDRSVDDDQLRGSGITEVRTLVAAFGQQRALAEPEPLLVAMSEALARESR
jgi:glycerate 2-kinase